MSNQTLSPEELEKLWKWCGLTVKFENGVCYRIDDKSYADLPLTLDNLFRFAVPKVVKKITKIYRWSDEESEHLLLHKWHNLHRQGFSWEVALAKAILEVVG